MNYEIANIERPIKTKKDHFPADHPFRSVPFSDLSATQVMKITPDAPLTRETFAGTLRKFFKANYPTLIVSVKKNEPFVRVSVRKQKTTEAS